MLEAYNLNKEEDLNERALEYEEREEKARFKFSKIQEAMSIKSDFMFDKLSDDRERIEKLMEEKEEKIMLKM